ncbi:MAG: hypothetical protein R2734_15515 [Nocardioides sp.]
MLDAGARRRAGAPGTGCDGLPISALDDTGYDAVPPWSSAACSTSLRRPPHAHGRHDRLLLEREVVRELLA